MCFLCPCCVQKEGPYLESALPEAGHCRLDLGQLRLDRCVQLGQSPLLAVQTRCQGAHLGCWGKLAAETEPLHLQVRAVRAHLAPSDGPFSGPGRCPKVLAQRRFPGLLLAAEGFLQGAAKAKLDPRSLASLLRDSEDVASHT